MKLIQNEVADAAYLRLSESKIEEVKAIEDGIIIDYDANGKVVGIEILYVSKR